MQGGGTVIKIIQKGKMLDICYSLGHVTHFCTLEDISPFHFVFRAFDRSQLKSALKICRGMDSEYAV